MPNYTQAPFAKRGILKHYDDLFRQTECFYLKRTSARLTDAINNTFARSIKMSSRVLECQAGNELKITGETFQPMSTDHCQCTVAPLFYWFKVHWKAQKDKYEHFFMWSMNTRAEVKGFGLRFAVSTLKAIWKICSSVLEDKHLTWSSFRRILEFKYITLKLTDVD